MLVTQFVTQTVNNHFNLLINLHFVFNNVDVYAIISTCLQGGYSMKKKEVLTAIGLTVALSMTGCASKEITQTKAETTVELGLECSIEPTDNSKLGSQVNPDIIAVNTSSVDTNYIDYTHDEEREKLMQWIKEDTQRVVDSVKENTLAGPPSYTEATPEDFDIHCEIRNYDEIDEEKLAIFIMAGYPDTFLNVASTFIEECNITTKIEYSDEGTDLIMDGYDCIILFANNTNYLIFYNDTEMFIKEI